MEHYNDEEPVNIGSGIALSISDLAETIKEVTKYKGNLHFDSSKPDGMPNKVLDSSYIFSLGWKPSTSFNIFAEKTYISFITQKLDLVKEKI